MSKTEDTTNKVSMDDIVSLCKRRGFVYQGSEIYGGEAGLYDFGPYGVELLNNIKKSWWRANVHGLENFVGLDSAMFKNPKVWEASGHVGGFSDPLAECRNCNPPHQSRQRARENWRHGGRENERSRTQQTIRREPQQN
jgi:glycyl-tRNA synthetase